MRAPITAMQFKDASTHGDCVVSLAHFSHINRLIEQHRIHRLIERTFGQDAVTDTYQALSKAEHVGKLVIALD
jgi:D-arabinose 1-dehydrogenase-like Zn-dependent alcohol dehydrogenase